MKLAVATCEPRPGRLGPDLGRADDLAVLIDSNEDLRPAGSIQSSRPSLGASCPADRRTSRRPRRFALKNGQICGPVARGVALADQPRPALLGVDGHNQPHDLPVRLRLLRRTTQRREVDAHQRDGRHQGRDHLRPAADHPPRGPRDRAPDRRAAGPRRHPGAAPAAHAARSAAQRRRARDAGRGRRRRVLRAGRPRRSVPATGTSPTRSPTAADATRSRSSPRPTCGDATSVASSCSRSSALADFAEIVPVSAVGGEQVDLLGDLLVGLLPEGPQLYPDGELTRRAGAGHGRRARPRGRAGRRTRRAAALARRRRRGDGAARGPPGRPPAARHPRRDLYVERDSQKAIVIGKGGERLRSVGTRSREQIEALLGTPVFLDLRVKVAKDWQRDPKQLRRLGF